MSFTIGCDPELFVIRKHDGKLVSANGLVKGNKKEPFKVNRGAIQVDGMALEFNTDPVEIESNKYNVGDRGFENFNRNIVTVLSQLKEAVGEDYNFSKDSFVIFDKEYYDNEVPPEAKELGCDPDFNAYTGGLENPAPDSATSLRGAAGHIHIGWGENIPQDHPDHVEICNELVKCLDSTVGLLMVLYEPDGDRRKEAYGKAGAHRRKPYGVEYRVPSNQWIFTRNRRRRIFEFIEFAILEMKRGSGAFWKSRLSEEQIQDIINTGDKVRARTYLDKAYGSKSYA